MGKYIICDPSYNVQNITMTITCILSLFMQGLLNLQCEISQSPILRQFLTQTTADKDDEAFNSRIRNTSDST